MSRTRVLILYGGRSSEHQVSCLSAQNVLAAIDDDRYEVVAVGITREGRWVLTDGDIRPEAGQALPEVADDTQLWSETFERGMIRFLKPRLMASLALASSWETPRTSPRSPTSPKIAVS